MDDESVSTHGFFQFDFDSTSELQYLFELFDELEEEIECRTLTNEEYFHLLYEIYETLQSIQQEENV